LSSFPCFFVTLSRMLFSVSSSFSMPGVAETGNSYSFPATLVTTSALAGVVLGTYLGYRVGRSQAILTQVETQQAPWEKENAPVWLRDMFDCQDTPRVFLREWEDGEWRKDNGWKGCDLIHNPDSQAVVVRAYFWYAFCGFFSPIVCNGLRISWILLRCEVTETLTG
jgi:hypothetical protein